MTLTDIINEIQTNCGASCVSSCPDCLTTILLNIANNYILNPGNAPGFLLNDGNGNFSWVPLQHSEDYFFTNTASDISGDKQMTTTSISSQFTITTASVTDTLVLQNWATNANVPDTLTIPEGLYQVNVHAAQTVGTKAAQIYADIVEVNATGTDIAIIGTTGYSTVLTGSQSDIFITFDLANSYVMASATSRIVARIRAHITGTGSAPTIVLYYGGVTDSHITIPATASFGGIVPPSLGGTGQDSSGSTGIPYVNAGTWSFLGTQTALDDSGKPATTLYADRVAGDLSLDIYAALGSAILAQSVGVTLNRITTSLNISTGNAILVATWLRTTQTVHGIKWWQTVKGSYTGTHGFVDICSYSGGNLTQQAVSNDDTNLLQTATSGTMGSKAFNTSPTLSPGLYFLRFLYTASAVTTTPAIGGSTSTTGLPSGGDFTNGSMLFGVWLSQTSLGSTSISNFTVSGGNYWLGLY